MSYLVAIKCFNENVASTGPTPGADPRSAVQFNLNQGLANLAESIGDDMAELRQQVRELREEIACLRRG
jgi:hypothetical protein